MLVACAMIIVLLFLLTPVPIRFVMPT